MIYAKFPISAETLEKDMVLHSGKKAYRCAVCCKEIVYKNSLNKQMNVHSSEALKWPDCSILFFREAHLREHVTAVHQGPTCPCPKCSKAFCRKSGLNVHFKTCGMEKPPKVYHCRHCGKWFHTKQEVYQHKVKHGAPQLVCLLCGKMSIGGVLVCCITKNVHQKAAARKD